MSLAQAGKKTQWATAYNRQAYLLEIKKNHMIYVNVIAGNGRIKA